MPNLTLRGCCIGTGRPKVIIPIVERTESAILEKAAAFSTLKADCVEWQCLSVGEELNVQQVGTARGTDRRAECCVFFLGQRLFAALSLGAECDQQ